MSIPNIGSVSVPPATAVPPAVSAPAASPEALGSIDIIPAVPAAVTPPMATIPTAKAEVSAIGASEPLPVADGVPVQRSPQNTEPPVDNERQTPISDLNHQVATPGVVPSPVPVAAPAPAAAPAVAAAIPPAAAVAAPAAAAVSQVADPDPASTRVAGGALPPPVVEVEDEPKPPVEIQVAESVRKKAERHGVDLATVTGTGRGGKIIGRDVDLAIAAKEAAASAAPAVSEADPVAEAAAAIASAAADAESAVAVVTPEAAVEAAVAPAASAPLPVAVPVAPHTPTTEGDHHMTTDAATPEIHDGGASASPPSPVPSKLPDTVVLTLPIDDSAVLDLGDAAAINSYVHDLLPNLVVQSVSLRMADRCLAVTVASELAVRFGSRA